MIDIDIDIYDIWKFLTSNLVTSDFSINYERLETNVNGRQYTTVQ